MDLASRRWRHDFPDFVLLQLSSLLQCLTLIKPSQKPEGKEAFGADSVKWPQEAQNKMRRVWSLKRLGNVVLMPLFNNLVVI